MERGEHDGAAPGHRIVELCFSSPIENDDLAIDDSVRSFDRRPGAVMGQSTNGRTIDRHLARIGLRGDKSSVLA
jgi:hypothetical protein